MSILERVPPKSAGLGADALSDYLDRLGESGCHSVMVLRHGKVALEGWWDPYRKEYNHIAYSLSKSFVSVAIGFAVQEKLLKLDDHVTDFFPERLPCRPCENMQKLKIRHLLTMSMGHRGITDHDFYRSHDWLDEILHLYLEKEPGTDFFYDNRCTLLCSVILQKLTGLTVYEYLKPRLFEPLGIENVWWETRSGYNPGGWGLNLKTEDIAVFGQFLLNRGQWQGKQLLDPEYIDAAGSAVIANAGVSVYDWADWQKGYGYFFWQCVPEGVYRGDGAFGQFVIVAPRQDMVVAITAGTDRACELLEATWTMLDDALADTAGSDTLLKEKAAKLSIPACEGDSCPEELKRYSGKTFEFPKNEAGFEKLSIVFGAADEIHMVIDAEEFDAFSGHGRWIETATGFQSDRFNAMTSFFYGDVACSSGWREDEYIVKLVFTRTPYTDTMHIRFDGNAVRVKYVCSPVLPLRHGIVELTGCISGKE